MNVTSNAVQKVKQLMEKESKAGHALRVAVRGGGCSGFEYEMTYDDKAKETDHKLEFEGLDVFVDGMSLIYLEDVTIDYVDSLQGAGFKIENPKASGTCGCGHSFSM